MGEYKLEVTAEQHRLFGTPSESRRCADPIQLVAGMVDWFL